MDKKTIFKLEIIFLIQLAFSIYLIFNLYPIHYPSAQYLSFYGGVLSTLVNLVNTFLLWLISRRLFKHNLSLIPPFIYAINPWGNYLAVAGSATIYCLLLILLSLYLILVIPRAKIIVFILLGLVFVATVIVNKEFVRIFSDPGLINNVESFQVEANQVGLGMLSKLAENRYINSAEYVFLKYVKNLTPSTFFTSQEKLLNFSFSPPIYFGFIFPFFYGIYLVTISKVLRKRLLISTILVAPSLLANKMVDLNRLVTFSPVVIFVISYGLVAMLERRKNRVLHAFLILSAILLAVQMIITLMDINIREQDRYVRYFGDRFEIMQ